MLYILENATWKVTIASLGAEIKSVFHKAAEQEYMWNGDPKYWGRTSPVLFPFVGSLKDKQYVHENISYAMGQHGFARDMEFEVETQTENEIFFVLKSTEETYQKYPFSFVLHIGYRLEDNKVQVFWKVENAGEHTMYFSIGAHPAFLCPIQGESDKIGYGLAFGGLENEIHHHGNTASGMAIMEDQILPLQGGNVFFTEGFFDTCTYMVEGKQTGQVSLITPDGTPYVTVTFDTPLFAIWSPERKNAPFVCIEPWYGRCDRIDFSGELKERDYTNVLEAGETFDASYEMSFYNLHGAHNI